MENMENVFVKTRTTPKDFFLNLGWLVTLYGSVIALLNLLFDVINQVYPDAINGAYSHISSGYSAGIRWSIAWLVVFFPIYIIITRYLRRSFLIDSSKRELWVRKWLVYLTLFLSILAIAIDLVVLINSFLGGELTARFSLKVLATLVVAGAVFGYYFYDLRTDGGDNKTGKMFAYGSALLVIASLVWAFVVIGSPMNERLRRFDEQKVSDLQNIQWQVINYWQSKGKLPADLSALSDSISGYKAPADPQTQTAYIYKITGAKTFQLCSTFNLTNGTSVGNLPVTQEWGHIKGDYCFDKSIDEQLYPVKLTPMR